MPLSIENKTRQTAARQIIVRVQYYAARIIRLIRIFRQTVNRTGVLSRMAAKVTFSGYFGSTGNAESSQDGLPLSAEAYDIAD